MNPMYVVIPMFLFLIIIILTMNQYSALEWLFFLCFLVIIAVIGTNYFLGIQLTTVMKNLFTKPEINTTIVKEEAKPPPPPPPPPEDSDNEDSYPNKNNSTKSITSKTKTTPETYHIRGQYDYSKAAAVCKAYNGQLATLDQIKKAFQKGAEWCDYGWSEDSMVLYPTQENSWKEYQNTNDPQQCGIPGVNGGYNNHVNQRLGVNCFGVKPPGTMPIYPSPVTITKTSPNLPVSPFNYKKWFE
jgi:hypothetical protein